MGSQQSRVSSMGTLLSGSDTCPISGRPVRWLSRTWMSSVCACRSSTRRVHSWFHTGWRWRPAWEVSSSRRLFSAWLPSCRRHQGLLVQGKPHTGSARASTSVTCSSPLKESGSETPPAGDCGPSGSAAMSACSRESDCSTADATARITASRPTAASATEVKPGGMLISSRLGSTIIPGRSTVSRRVRNACRIGMRMMRMRL
mmetsp:Transcript_731/g.2187  ORF Transcript_731/g.2187 Transcript_731/m.2187 type:complete len:202 (-) Transcript_731:962-1567(-)